MKRIVTFEPKSTLGRIITVMDALRLNDKHIDKRKEALKFIRYDAKMMMLEVCEGHVLMRHILSPEKDSAFIGQFFGVDGYCVMQGKDALLVEDFRDEGQEAPKYPNLDRVIPDIVGRRFDSITMLDANYFERKYAHLLTWHLVGLEADMLFDPRFFEMAKDVLPLMPNIWFPHIETAEEEEERLAKEKTMTNEEIEKTRKALIHNSRLPIVMESDDRMLRYVIMPVSANGIIYRRNEDD